MCLCRSALYCIVNQRTKYVSNNPECLQYFAPLLVVWSAQLTFLIVLPMVRGPVYSLLASLATASLEMFTETGTDTEAEEGQVSWDWWTAGYNTRL